MKITLMGYLHGKGGIQTHTHYLATGLVEHGHDVCVVSPPPRNGHAHASTDGITYEMVGYDTVFSALTAVRRTNPDVAVICGTGYKAMLSVLLAGNAKKVFFEVMSGAPMGPRDPRRLVHWGFDAVVGQGTAVAAKFRDAFGWTGSTEVIPALPEPLERKISIPRREAQAAGDRPLAMAYFGRLAAHKNVGFLIDHWEAIAGPGGILDIWGTGPEQQALFTQIVTAGLSDRIALKGRYPEGAEYIELLRRYDMTLLATVGDEGAPLVLLEAMAAGVPFVANGVGGIGDYRNPDCAVTSGDIEEFVPMAQELVKRLREGQIDSTRLQAHYDSLFGYGPLVERWEAFLTSLIQKKA